MNYTSMKKQNGAALAIGLILLVIITLMGYTSMKGTMLQEKMAAGLHNRTLANSGANSALREGEDFLYHLVEETNGVDVVGTAEGSFNKIYSYLLDSDDSTSAINPKVTEFMQQNWTSGSGTEHGFDFTVVHDNAKLKTKPQYLIYELVNANDSIALKILGERFFRSNNQLKPNERLEDSGYFWDDGKFYFSKTFSLTDNGLMFTFAAYEIGPYAIGMPEFTIPYTELKPYLTENSPLKRLIQ